MKALAASLRLEVFYAVSADVAFGYSHSVDVAVAGKVVGRVYVALR